jgi:peptide/nickel transport system substrate-binding protein
MFFFMVGLDTDAIEMNNNFEASGHLNPFHTTDPTVTSLMSRINSELDPTKAADLYQQLNAYTVRQAWNAPIFYAGSAWATDKHVTYLAGGASTIPTVRNFGVAG